MKKLPCTIVRIGKICMLPLLEVVNKTSAQAPNISYPSRSYSFTVGTTTSPLAPNNIGCSVTASLGTIRTLAGSGSIANDGSAGTAVIFNYP